VTGGEQQKRKVGSFGEKKGGRGRRNIAGNTKGEKSTKSDNRKSWEKKYTGKGREKKWKRSEIGTVESLGFVSKRKDLTWEGPSRRGLGKKI